MLKYCFIKDIETGLVQLGAGCPDEYYQEIGMEQREVQQSDVDYQWYLADKCPIKTEEQKQEEERQRILGLSMTRSDFFDATIMAFGANENDLLTVLSSLLATIPLSNTEKKIALNNYKNALNFYRKHTLFTLLSGVPIPISETETITITSEQWDRFFDTRDYRELLPREEE